ncbi:heat shock protein transcriptional repressor HspR [Candidatus Poriferisodalis sp.]|uniref:heat shock protein transcriptional repressor HspR n=1 Tax=Candidatus Poriferisodalis sp. TaxID=3101277 RepID=UPI003B02B046
MSEQPRRPSSASERHRALYIISVAAELAGVHAQTLRIYERKGLLAPARTSGGSRRYSDRDIAMLNRISQLTSEGLNLAGVKRVLELEERVATLERELAEARAAAAAAVAQTHRHYRRDLVPMPRSDLVPHRPIPPNPAASSPAAQRPGSGPGARP